MHLPLMFCQFSEEAEASAFIEAGPAQSAAVHTSIWSSIPDIVSPLLCRCVVGKLRFGFDIQL